MSRGAERAGIGRIFRERIGSHLPLAEQVHET